MPQWSPAVCTLGLHASSFLHVCVACLPPPRPPSASLLQGAGHARDLARLLFLSLDGAKRGCLDKSQLETMMAALWPAASRSDVDSMLRAVLAPAGDAAGSAAATGDGAASDGATAAFPAFADWFVARDGAMSAVQMALLGGDDDSHLLPVSKRSA